MVRLILIITLSVLISSCNKQEKSQSFVIDTAQFSKSNSVLSTFPSDKKRCWGVSVLAKDLKLLPSNSCRPPMSVRSGFVEEGELLEVSVTQGLARHIQVRVGLVGLQEDCVSMETLNDYSHTYTVHSEKVNLVSGNTDLHVNASFPGEGHDVATKLGLATSNCEDGVSPIVPITISDVVPMFPVNGVNWNDYVSNLTGNLLVSSIADNPCGTAAELRYNTCVHGGEFRKFRITGLNSCDGLSASDDIDAFKWNCVAYPTSVVIYSSGLKLKKGLTDLIDSGGWKSNKVTVTKAESVNIYSTTPSVWWSNSVQALPDSSSGEIGLFGEGFIFYLDGVINSKGYTLMSDKISIVTLPGSEITAFGTTPNCNNTNGLTSGATDLCLIYSGGRHFLWIEGNFKSTAGIQSLAVSVLNSKYSRFNNIFTKNFDRGLALYTSHGNFGQNLNFGGKTGSTLDGGLYVKQSTKNSFYFSRIANHKSGISVLGAKNSFVNMNISNSSTQGVSSITADNTFVQLTSHHNQYNGFAVTSNAQRNTLAFSSTIANTNYGVAASIGGGTGFDAHSIVSAGNIEGARISSINNARISDFVSIQNSQFGIRADISYTNIDLLGYTLMGGNGSSDCSVNSGYAGVNFTDGSCTGLSGFIGSQSLSSSYVGMVTADSVNQSHSGGTATASAINDWAFLENIFRGWGENLTDELTGGTDRCDTTESCAIYDYQLKSTDTTILNRSFDGSTVNILGVGACPASMMATYTDQQSTPNTFLLRAIELIGDFKGDDDGLCESNESCIYTPNIGAYQGRGELEELSCQFQDSGAVTGVQLYKHKYNGI